MNLSIREQPLPYVEALPERDASEVVRVVIHCTELPDLATAREYGEKVLHASGTGNSGHYYIDRDGTILRYVPGTRIANHARLQPGFNRHRTGESGPLPGLVGFASPDDDRAIPRRADKCLA